MLEQLIKLHEGLRLKPYRCTAGKLTIGYGRNLQDIGISEEEAEAMLRADIDRCKKQLETIPWFKKLCDARQAVLIDMCFNLGFDGLMKFRRTLLFIENQNYKSAAAEMLNSRWANQVGSRALRLSRMMKTGEFCG